jgi:hypothetical protein
MTRMAGLLRLLGMVVLLVGFGVAGGSGWLLAGDERFREVAAAYARHPDNALFQTEYWSAAAWHYGLVAACAGGLLGGLSVGGMLLGLAEVLRRVSRR